MLEDPRLSRNNVRVPRRDGYVKHPALSVTIHPNLKKTFGFNVRTYWNEGVSQVTDEVLYTCLIEMLEGIDGRTEESEESEESEGDTVTTAPILSEVTGIQLQAQTPQQITLFHSKF